MEYLLTNEDRLLIAGLTAELKRLNDREEYSQEPELVLSVNEAAGLSGCSRQTISRKIRQGELHKVACGGVVGIPKSELTHKKSP